MKKLEEFTKEELWALRQEICLNSLYVSDYHNTFGISERSACTFFDGYMDYLCELAEEDGWDGEKLSVVFGKYDNADNLEAWFYCYDDFSWVEYEKEE